MNTSASFEALRRANPRDRAGFAEAVDAAAETVQARIGTVAPLAVGGGATRGRRVGLAAGASLAAVAVAAAALTIGWPQSGPGVETAVAAVKRAAAATAASAERSGTATVRITHDGELWGISSIRWNGDDLAVSRPGRAGSELLVVDGILYGADPEVDGGWIELGSPESIDPGSGTTPDEYLAAVREDVGGTTLRRLTTGVSGLMAEPLDDGSTVYRGTVASGLIARETGFKEGRAIRVLPFGYVAHDEAADADALLDVAVTVGADGIVRRIDVVWGTWRYTVAYAGLGTTPAPTAPANARSLLRERLGRD